MTGYSNFMSLSTKFPKQNLVYHAVCPNGDYIGRTKNLNNRIKKHLNNGTLSLQCKVAIKQQLNQKIAQMSEKIEICNKKPSKNKIKYRRFCRKLKKENYKI